ncbi:HK-domain-containing protein [Thozetella sp. PMI_491]|nr:HK-domain-containing protein [Thozetella sp. PMI_491]
MSQPNVDKSGVDYALYLVTDSTPSILGHKSLVDVVEAAIQGGVTIVQFRDKKSDTGDLVRIGRQLHQVTQKYGVPLLINDRVDVALAVGCEGVHVGQDDMDLATAQALLGPQALIGVSASTIEEALTACAGGADYLGIGTVYATATKTNTKNIIGTQGLHGILGAIADAGYQTPAVCIGGIGEANLQYTVFQSGSIKKSLNGVAVVSAIMAAANPRAAAQRLLGLLRPLPPFQDVATKHRDTTEVLALVPELIRTVHENKPLSHNMTNLVVQNFAANVALAVGASPIMANYAEEAADLAALGGALVINMGTVTPDGLDNYVKALKAYNTAKRPVVYDPVGAGATAVRRSAVRTILAGGCPDIIKGNESEIKTVATIHDESQGDGAQQRGVDSSSTLNAWEKVQLIQKLARDQETIVIMTGTTDFISDGERSYSISNGHEYLGMVTGTGCVLGTTVSAFVSANPGRELAATLAAMLLFEIASERAAVRQDVRGPGTFVPAFLDELYQVRQETARNDIAWLSKARLSRVL